MPKSFRLSQADFELLRKQKSHRIHGVFFSVATYTLPSPLRGPRVAAVIPKKVVSKATARNKIERWCREATRANKKLLQPNYAYILSPKKNVTDTSYTQIKNDIQDLFERAASGSTIHRT